MATKTQKSVREQITEVKHEEKRGGLGWLWYLLAVAAFVLLVSVVHISGVARGPEEGIYRATKNVPVLKWFTGWMHKDELEQKLSLKEMVDAKDITNNLVRAEGKITKLEDEIKQLNNTIDDLADVGKRMEKIDGTLKEMQEYGGAVPVEGVEGAEPLPVVAGGEQQAAAPGGAPGAAVSMGSGDNYRLIGKVFEKIEADTAVDIMSNMSDVEKVKILASMKEATVASILSALDPQKSADLTRMLATMKK